MKSRAALLALLALLVIAFGPSWLGVDGLVPTPSRPRVNWERLVRPAALLALGCACLQLLAFRAVWLDRISALRYVFIATALSASMAFGLRAAGEAGGYSLASSVYAQGYAEDAARFESLPELLANYNRRQAELLPHSRTHPVGPVALFGGMAELAALTAQLSPTTWGFSSQSVLALALTGNSIGTAVVLLACLWLLPLFVLVRELKGRKTALVAVGLGAALPAILLIAPMVDALHPLFVSAAGLAMWRALKAPSDRRGFLWGLLAGLLTSALLLLSYGNLACLPLLLLLAIYGARGHARQAVPSSLGLLAGLAAVWLGLRLFGYHYFEGLKLALDFHATGVTARRDWLPYLFSSPYTFLLWLGLPVAAGIFRGALPGNRTAFLARGLLVVILALTLAGKARGETERLWLGLVPFAMLSIPALPKTKKPPVHLIAATLLFTLAFAALTGQYA